MPICCALPLFTEERWHASPLTAVEPLLEAHACVAQVEAQSGAMSIAKTVSSAALRVRQFRARAF